MGLKGDRLELKTSQSYFMNEVATRGGVVVISTGGSGAGNDQSAALVTYTVASGSCAVGLLLNDMVNIDQTRQMINKHQDQVQKGQKVTLLQDGWVVTNMIATGDNPDPGDTAYVVGTGLLASTGTGYDIQIGIWETKKDEDGYAKVSVRLPARGVRT